MSKTSIVRNWVALASIVIVLVGVSGFALGSQRRDTNLTACYDKKTGAVVLIKQPGLRWKCRAGTKSFTFAQRGPRGLRGRQGIQGPAGDAGSQGPVGPAGPQGPVGPTATEVHIALLPTRLHNELIQMQGCGGSPDYFLMSHKVDGCPLSDLYEDVWAAIIDPSDYPGAAGAMLEVAMTVNDGATACVQLFDLTTDTSVAGSEICSTNGSGAVDGLRVRSTSFSLPNGEHEYSVQAKPMPNGSSTGELHEARLVIDW